MQEEGKKTEYWNKFYRKWTTIQEFVDIETGEYITKEEFKNYKKIEITKRKSYGKNYGYHITTYIGRRKPKQLNLWGHE